MLRRSAPVLLGLFVCLTAAHLSSANNAALRLDESRIRVALDDDETRVTLEVLNTTGRSISTRVEVELLDPRDKVRAASALDAQVRHGASTISVPFKLPFSDLLNSERAEFAWYRLRYRLVPNGSDDAPPAVEGIVSISEVTPDLFELRVVSSSTVRAGSTLRARIRTANPVNARPVKGVAVSGELKFDGGNKPLVFRASATTGGDGSAYLEYDLPRSIGDNRDNGELTITARRGALVEEARAEVSVEQKPRIILTSDKSLYQPGQTMHVRALVFDPSEHAAADAPVTLTLEDEDEQVVFRTEAKTSRYGIASADWVIADNARLGSYAIKVELGGDRYDHDEEERQMVKISRYDLPNFSVTTKADRAFYLAGQDADVEVRGDYLFGQPVKRGHVRVVRQTERQWNYKEQKYDIEESQAVEGDLDADGRFVAHLDLSGEHRKLAEADYSRFEDLDFAAYVNDTTTGRTEQRRFSLRLTKDPIHVYVNEGRYRQAKGLPLAFYVSTFYADGTPAECEVSVVEEGETSVVVFPGEPRHETKEPDRTILKIRTNRYGVAKVTGPAVKTDETRRTLPLKFVARDREGRVGHYEDDFWISDYDRKLAEIRVETDKTLYRAGEPIAVELSSNYARAGIVVDASVDDRIVFSKTVRLSGGRASLVFPYSDEFRDAVRLSATSTEPNDEDAADDESYSYGTRTVVFPRDRELKLDVRMSQAKYRPGEDAVAQLAVRSADGRRAEGALGVVVFDKAVEERARTDEEFSSAWGFGSSLYGVWYANIAVAGFTQRDIERLDLTKPQPDGLEAVAEMLYNAERPYDEEHVTSGQEFEHRQSEVFGRLINAQLKPLKDALDKRYARSAEYPSDEASLARQLSEAGLDFAALRDPWGQPYHARFSFSKDRDLLDIYSDGADEREGTDDDFKAASFSWPYFRSLGEKINRAVADYHARTGGYVRDFATLREESRRAGLDLDALRDRWGQPYRFDFEINGTFYLINVRSGGANKTFEPHVGYGSDDFTIWTTHTDYFKESRGVVDATLARNLNDGGLFPQDEDALRRILGKYGVNPEALHDGWGNQIYYTFTSEKRYADRVTLSERRRFDAEGGTHRNIQPITQTIWTIMLRSVGADGKTGTSDDFTLGYFTSVAAEQSALDSAPQSPQVTTILSGGTGAITGMITDPNGAVIANATVRAKHNFADLEFSATTDADGIYLLRNLPSGLYTLTFEATGFQRTTIVQVPVQSANLTKVDATLNIGAVTETVTVTAEGMHTETAASEVSAAVEKHTVTSLPLSTPRLREFFPETLVWQPALETDRTGHAQLRFKLADNITTWKMSVIASTEDGQLGVAEKEFLAFQPFFVEHDPPRVLTEGDRISLPVVLRNYLERAQGVDVEMKPEGWFALEGPARTHTEVAAGDTARPTFDFRAVASISDGKQRITAVGDEANDAIEKPVTVHPDGEERSETAATVLGDTGVLDIEVPAETIRGSAHSELKIYPNLTAHLVEGIEAIMRRPYGCGEQTISSSYPSVLMLDHYKMTAGSLDGDLPAVVERARRYARLGYERLLGYRAPGGGFTYWGRGEPDLALTAYALRFLTDASRVIDVDESVVKETREWLIRQQRDDGSWPAHHYWSNTEDAAQTPLTTVLVARVLAAIEKRDAAAKGVAPKTSSKETATPRTSVVLPPVPRALRYLAARIEEVDEPYLIASYALAAIDAGDRKGAARAASKLRSLAHEEGPGIYWALETNTPFYGWGLAGRIETTALAVRALNAFCGSQNADCGLEDNAALVNQQSAISNPQSKVSQLIDRGLTFLLHSKDRYGVWYSTQATINVYDALLDLVAAPDAERARQTGPVQTHGDDAAEIFVNGRRAGEVALPPTDKLCAPVTFDLSSFVAPGNNRVELRRRGANTKMQAQAVTTFYLPWQKQTAAADSPKNRMTTTADGATNGDVAKNGGVTINGGESSNRTGAGALRLAVDYGQTNTGVNQEVTCNVTVERAGHIGYGMMLAEVGLPPGADVDRASLERTMKESDWSINSYDVLPDRLVVYLWPAAAGTRFQFKFRPRYGLDALTAPSQLYDYYNPEAHTVVPPTRFVVR